MLTFSRMDTLSNGDIFLHDVKMTQNAKKEPVTEYHQPGYEPSIRPVRKAMKPKIKPRLGVMCPFCYQSRVFFYSIEKSDDNNYKMAMVFGFDEGTLYYFYADQLINAVAKKLGPDKECNIGEGQIPYPEVLHEYFNILRLPDETLISLTEAVTTTFQDIASEWPANKKALCPHCGRIHTIQEWINEYAFPTAGYHDICKMCGGEMAIDCKTGFLANANDQPMKCEVCKYENKREFIQST